jgi:peptidoglycan/xylan/chitin deacetylase (PgdA/CDA1 family)
MGPHLRRVLGVFAVVLSVGVFGCSSTGGGTAVATSATVGTSALTTTTATTEPPTTTLRSTTTTKRTTTTKGTSGSGTPGKEYSRVPGSAKVVALTFDAAYEPAPLKSILATLATKEVPATFFLTGEFVKNFPDSVAAIVAGGYPIGNHSYSHPDFATIDDAAIKSQLRRTADLIEQAGAADPRPLFRPPYGSRDAHILSVLGDEGYVSVYWTIDTLDWETDRTGEQIRSAVLGKLQPGAIILMHVGGKATAGILPTLIDDLRAEGYGFVELRTALGSK